MHLTCLTTLLAAALWSAAAPAGAAAGMDRCTGVITSVPATITSGGVWCLQGNLATSVSSGAAITVSANDVTIDCGDYKMGNLAAGAGTLAYGIRSVNQANTLVQRCNVRGFYIGVASEGGTSALVQDNRLEGSAYVGVWVTTPGSTVRRNLVNDTGGSGSGQGASAGILVGEGADVVDNTVSGVFPGGPSGTVAGITSSGSPGGTLRGNRIKGLAPAAGAASWGIFSAATSALIAENELSGPGTPLSVGIFCRVSRSSPSLRVRNVVQNFAQVASDCRFGGSDAVNPN